ncbi:MAG: CDGSH iron-sulfur domain-containing protein [Ardenticatenaceae bacterium]|nr:CDGSH iron-sulfur domain-containing protein [Ardenticatenaceae bacterium]
MSKKNEIKASKNGPFLISGTATFTDANGNVKETEGKMFALCRCGQSANKPFCNGSHKRVNFEADEGVVLSVGGQ